MRATPLVQLMSGLLLLIWSGPTAAQYWTRLPQDAELQAAADAYVQEWLAQRKDNPCQVSASATHKLTKLHHKTDAALFLAHLEVYLTESTYDWDFRAKDCARSQPPVTRNDTFNAELYQDGKDGHFWFGNSLATMDTWLADYAPGWSPQAPVGKPPCPAAIREFGLDAQSATAMRYDLDDLRGQFSDAIARYNRENEQQTYATDNVLGTLPAISWLAHQGGTVDAVSKQFVFASDADRARWEKARTRTLPDADAGFGTERALVSAIYSASVAAKRKLTPGDVFYLALKQRNGNVKDALLLAHNTLRSLARVNDNMLTDVSQDIAFINDRLEQTVVKTNDLQNAGIWYHMFGTAYFEMQARGEWGVNTLAQVTVDGLGDAMFDVLNKMHGIFSKDPYLQLPQNRTSISVLANQVEQLYRKAKDGQADDPDKYCYNVFGAQLGAWLYREKLPAIDAKPPSAPATEVMTIFGVFPPGLDGEKIVISSSPLNLVWEGNGYRMSLDQRTGNLDGFYPLKLIPYFESDSKTWGLVWVDQLQQPYTLHMQASADGYAHITSAQNGQSSVYPIELKAGDEYQLELDNAAPLPEMVATQAVRAASIAPVSMSAETTTAAPVVEADDTGLPAEQPPVDDELAAAQREYDAAYSEYTTLVTVGGTGSVEAALARYKAAYERLQLLKAQRR